MSLLDLKVETLQGETTTVGDLTDGRAALIVNVASKCGLTPQYEGLQRLYDETEGLVVIGVPCNQFLGQEPGTAEEIAEFCSSTYSVTFPLLAKVDVNGPDRAPLFDELTAHADAGGHTGDVRWNFEKWLVSRDGEVVARFSPQVEPTAPELTEAIASATRR
jgi:glutathione peroxidase